MDIPHSSAGLEILSRQECLQRLASKTVGRLAFMMGDQPMVVPVNYASQGEVIVFRTGEGSKLDAARVAKVAFEIDDIDVATRLGWSVVVQGTVDEITDPDDSFTESLRNAATPPWIPGRADHYLRITPSKVSGRRVPALS